MDGKPAEKPTTQSPSDSPSHRRHSNLLSTILQPILHELDVIERLLRSNAGGSCFVFLGGLLARFLRAPPPSLADAVEATLHTLAVGFMCSYVFDICNQATSPEEDVLNKPYRPIPAGLITVDQAKARWFLSWTLGPLATHYFYGPWAAVHLLEFEAVIAFCYVWPRWFSWFNRNLFVFLLYTIQDRILNQALLEAADVPGWDLGVLIDLAVSAWFMGTVHVQEFHDLEGDRKSDRKTLPMLLSPRGLRRLRAGTAVYIVAFGSALAFFGYQKITMGQEGDSPVLITLLSALQLISSVALAYRIWASTSAEMDKATFYNLYYVPVFMILLSLPLVTT
ncbi:UbiA prenyltransferase family-domain-containing protein [Apiospora aurea]|uniref:UbiA prenyltransferase family-domain-containing protein n=1 Tax=Apiospora aurea TaxID=335848 RepID=A0ABR1PT99_9PEZI